MIVICNTPSGAGDRFHVHHVLDAADLFLQRRGHGSAITFGIGSGVDGAHDHRRRDDLGYSLIGRMGMAIKPAAKDHDGQYRGEDRPIG